MKIYISIALFILLLFSSIELIAQTSKDEDNPLNNSPINEQFDYTINKSPRYEAPPNVERRGVKGAWLSKLRSNVLDTMSSLEKRIYELELNSTKQQNKIDSLYNLLQETKTSLETAINEKNSLTFLGVKMSKSSYQNITISIIIILILGLAGVFAIYKKSIFVTNETKDTLQDLQEEFDEHRKRTLEREKTMARNHLNELNKLRNK